MQKQEVQDELWEARERGLTEDLEEVQGNHAVRSKDLVK